MLNRRIERLIEIILFVFIIVLLAIFVPESSNSVKTNIFFYIFTAMIFSCGIFCCYLRIRNSIFRHKINKYCNQKNYDAAISLLDRTIKGQSGITWLRIQRGIIFGLSGKFDNFWKEFGLIYNHKPFCKKKLYKCYLPFIVISDGLDFIDNTSAKMKLSQQVNGKSIEKYLKPPFLHIYKAIHAYQNNDIKNAVYHASWLYNEKSDFLKLFSSFLLMNSYKKLGEMEKFILYKNMYLSNPIKTSEFR